ncbi:MAG: fatty acid desaturase [Pseudomonadota bacterium]
MSEPRDHRAFLASLPEETRRELGERADAPGLRRLLGHGGLIIAVGALIAVGAPGWPLLMAAQGVLIMFLFTAQHECTHKTPFRTEQLNEWTGRIAGLLIFQPFEWFRYFHLAHHRWTNDPARDPELAEGKPEGWGALLVHLSGLSYWRGDLGVLARNAFGDPAASYVPRSAHKRLRREARAMLAIYAAVALFTIFVSPALLYVWLIPILLGAPALRLYLLAEHGRCPPVANTFENTRTTLTVAALRYIAWNMPFHAEHHAAPAVPFHRLPRLHDLARGELRCVERGYLRFIRRYALSFRQV